MSKSSEEDVIGAGNGRGRLGYAFRAPAVF
jgi:hypothetical protein